MGIVNQSVEYGIGVGGVPNDSVPCRYGKLAGDDRRTAAVTIFEDFEQIMTGLLVERFETPIVEHQELNMAKGSLQPGITSVATRERELGEQSGNALIVQTSSPRSAFRNARSCCRLVYIDLGST
jgi:hypothetical protein